MNELVPGAQQLELLRRLNLAARDLAAHPGTELVDRVLRAPAAGRGRTDLPLPGTEHAFGPRPVDPSRLPAHELVRVACVLLAEDLVALGPDPVPTSWARPWRLRFRLLGDPLVVASAAAHLAARGRPQGGVRPFVVVAGAPMDDLLAHTWTRLCFESGCRSWVEWIHGWQARGALPHRADLAVAAQKWSRRWPFVRVVTDPARLPHALGVRRLPAPTIPSADQAELARRIAAVLGLLAAEGERPQLMRTLGNRMPHTGTPAVSVPPSARAWVDASADKVVRDVRRAHYAVVGDLEDLRPRWDGAAPAGPTGQQLDELVLRLAVRMLVDPDWRTTPPKEGPQ